MQIKVKGYLERLLARGMVRNNGAMRIMREGVVPAKVHRGVGDGFVDRLASAPSRQRIVRLLERGECGEQREFFLG
jgi:hypothetical protein